MKRILPLFVSIVLPLVLGNAQATGYFNLSAGATSPDSSSFEDSEGFRIGGGYFFNEYVAVEGAYTNLGEFDADDELVAALELVGGIPLDGASVEVEGFEFGLRGEIQASDIVTIYLRAGILRWDADFNIDTMSSGTFSDSDEGTDPYIGAGIGINVTPTINIGLEYMAYDAADGDVDYTGIGVAIRF